MTENKVYDAVVVGGGPAGATAANDLAQAGRNVVLLDRAGRIKPCGGAIPPQLIREFDIPMSLLCAQIGAARIISPSDRRVNMPIEGGFVGMVNRETFDEYLRDRAAENGAERRTGTFSHITRDSDGLPVVHYNAGNKDGEARQVKARLVVGADGARSQVAKQQVPGGDKVKCVYAYHEIVDIPENSEGRFDYDGKRCDVVYNGKISPDFYGWVFPHGSTASVGTGSAQKGFGLRAAVEDLRKSTGLDRTETVRREGAPIPMQPLKRWENGKDVILAGDAAGVVAPSSGEGIYYAMTCGRISAEAGEAFLATGNPRQLKRARRKFMWAHGQVFWVLGMMQWFWYTTDKRRERFVSICADEDVQKLTWEAYMNKKLVRARPAAHARIFFKDMAHILGLIDPTTGARDAKQPKELSPSN
jgi:geranylgeranyl reductase